MGMELEFKYQGSKEALSAMEAAFGGGFATIVMETTYYDTPERALSARRWTLRHRSENGVSVCTLKTPGEKGARKELECGERDIRQAIPVLCKLGEPELGDLTAGGVIPVCGAAFTRRARLLPTADGTAELALDQGVLLGGGREAPLCEVEIELKSGSPEAALALARQIAARFHLKEEKKSKFRRALDLAEGER